MQWCYLWLRLLKICGSTTPYTKSAIWACPPTTPTATETALPCILHTAWTQVGSVLFQVSHRHPTDIPPAYQCHTTDVLMTHEFHTTFLLLSYLYSTYRSSGCIDFLIDRIFIKWLHNFRRPSQNSSDKDCDRDCDRDRGRVYRKQQYEQWQLGWTHDDGDLEAGGWGD